MRRGKVSWLTFVYALAGFLASIGDKVVETTQWSDILTPPLFIFGALGMMNAILAHLTVPENKQ